MRYPRYRREFFGFALALALSPFTVRAQTGWDRWVHVTECGVPIFHRTGDVLHDALDADLRNWARINRDIEQALVLLNPALGMLMPPLGWTKRWETRFSFATAPAEAAAQMGPWAIAALCDRA